jgi:RHH-type transcriptional regulator, proline utilization regulon repressor / proline dehydrogenase / delta 1-pyrroline-5-carboxylate dehydrogenase
MPESPVGDLPSREEVEQLVRRWAESSVDAPLDRDAARLDELLREPRGFDFAVGVVDRVIRPDDPLVAARNLERLSRRLPQFLPRLLRVAVVAGGGFGMLLPKPITPVTRAVFRRLVRHLVLDSSPKNLDKSLAAVRALGMRVDARLLLDRARGVRQADEHLTALARLLDRPDVDRVTVRLAAVAAPLSLWGFDLAVDELVDRVAPRFAKAARGRGKAITLDVGEFGDLDLALAVFTRLLADPELRTVDAGITLPAALPDTLPALDHLTAWARDRVAAGGAGIRVRFAPGDHTGAEQVDAALNGRPLATWASRAETDAHYLRLLSRALRRESTDVVRIGLATHDAFVLAFAHLLAESRGVSDRVDLEPTLGMAPALVHVARADLGRPSLSVPVVATDAFADAVPYLVRRLEESLTVVDLDDADALDADAVRFAASLALLADDIPSTHRAEDRSHAEVPRTPDPFANASTTDPALPGNRAWAREVLARAAHSTLGAETLAAARLTEPAAVSELVRAAAGAGAGWGELPGSRRAELLDRAGEVLAAFRGRLAEVLIAETGATLPEADAEASRAVDAAHYAAARARELAGIHGAVFVPRALVVVTPSRVLTVSVAARDVFRALAAGSAVLLAPPTGAGRSAAVLVEALWEAGVPRDVLGLVDVAGDAARALVTAPEVGRVLLTGSIETAALYRSWRSDLPLLAATTAVNSVIVTPSADLDRAVGDLVASAFGSAGQSCAATSVAILVGSVGATDRFRRRLADAVGGLATGAPFHPATQVGPLAEPATGRAARGLTQLAEGESWLVKPRALDASDTLWSPGVRDGVAPDGDALHTAFLAPVLSLVSVGTLDEAIALQNANPYGLLAGLQSLDAAEIAAWLEQVDAGGLVVNRALEPGVARRRPFGGWKRSAVGTGTHVGGPNELFVLGDWHPEESSPSEELHLDGLDDRVSAAIEAFQPQLEFSAFDRVRRAAFSDEEAWTTEFSRGHDPSALGLERNVFRYRPAEVVVRLSDGAAPADLARVLIAGVRVRARMLVSSSVPLPSGLLPYIDDGTPLGRSLLGILGVQVEDDEAFRARVARGMPARIRLIGGDPVALAHATGGSPDVAVWSGAVTGAGRVELLPFLREQSVTVTAHRYGIPDRDIAALVI